jgi:hypothetical protein
MIQTADDLFILISYNYFLFKYCKLQKKVHSIKFTSYLPMVGGFLRVLQLLPQLKLVARR